MRPKPRYQSVELIVPINTTGSQVNFPDVPELRSDSDKDALIFSIVVSTVDSVPLTPSGNAVATAAQVANGFLTLYVLGTEYVFNVPLVRFNFTKGNGATYFSTWEMFETKPLRVDWTKSFVSFGTPPANGAQFSYLFEFGYDWFPSGTFAQYLKNLDQAALSGLITY